MAAFSRGGVRQAITKSPPQLLPHTKLGWSFTYSLVHIYFPHLISTLFMRLATTSNSAAVSASCIHCTKSVNRSKAGGLPRMVVQSVNFNGLFWSTVWMLVHF